MFNRHHGPDPEILALMHEEELLSLLRRGTEQLIDEDEGYIVIEDERWRKTQGPQFVQGGVPGLGKRK